MEPKPQKSFWFPAILSIIIHIVLIITVFQVKILGTFFPGLSKSRIIELEKLAAEDEERIEQFIRETTSLETQAAPPKFGGSKISGLEFSDHPHNLSEQERPKSSSYIYPVLKNSGDADLIVAEEKEASGSLFPVSKKTGKKGGPVLSKGNSGIPLSVLKKPFLVEDFKSESADISPVTPKYQLPSIQEPQLSIAPVLTPPLPDYTKTEQIVSLDNDITGNIDLYRDPLSGDTFFRLSLQVKPSSKLPVFQKDNLFMIDVSSSVKDKELEKVFSSMKTIVPSLPAGDRYNIVNFHMKETSLFRKFMGYYPADRDYFLEFLKRPDRAVLTNLSNAIRRTLTKFPGKPDRPMNVTILTDGKVSAGKTSIAAVTSKYSQSRRAHHSIFTFNIGRPANLYMMEMMSYLGKGYMGDCEIEDNAPKELQRFLKRFSRISLVSCEAQYMLPQVSEVYPLELPNLFRDNTLEIYGKCEQGKEFTFRLKGKSVDGVCDFLIRSPLPDPDQRNKEIAREWARGRIYQLTEELINGAEVEDKIRTLAVRYGIKLPYDLSDK